MKIQMIAAAFLVVATAAQPIWAITVRPMSDQRIWQTCMKPSEDLKWPWAEGSSSAQLVFNSLCNGKSKTIVVARQGNAAYGTCAWPTNRGGGEKLYDITLTQLSGESIIETQTARVAMLPGVDGIGRATVRDPSLPGWRDSREKNPMFAYDAAWSDGEVSAVSISSKVGSAAAVETPLDGASGYSVFSAASTPSPTVSLLFDGDAEYEAACRYIPYGLLFLVY